MLNWREVTQQLHASDFFFNRMIFLRFFYADNFHTHFLRILYKKYFEAVNTQWFINLFAMFIIIRYIIKKESTENDGGWSKWWFITKHTNWIWNFIRVVKDSLLWNLKLFSDVGLSEISNAHIISYFYLQYLTPLYKFWLATDLRKVRIHHGLLGKYGRRKKFFEFF